MSVAVVLLGWALGVRFGCWVADSLFDYLDSRRHSRAALMRNVTPGRVA